MSTILSTVLPIIALGLALALILPQLVRIVRRRDARGTSVGGLVSGTLAFTGWLAYYLHLGERAASVAMLGGGTAYLVTAVLAARFDGDRRGLITPIVLGAALAGAAGFGGWSAFAVVLVTSVLWAYVPAVVTAWTVPSLVGLSPLAWILAATYGAVWAVFGLDRRSLAIILNGLLNLTLALGVLGALVVRRNSHVDHHPTHVGSDQIHGVVLETTDDP